MEQTVTIGIFRSTAAWQCVLEQIGVSYKEISGNDDISIHRYSILIVNRYLINNEFERVKTFVNGGGAIIDEGHCITALANGTLADKKCRYLFTDKLPFMQEPGILDIYNTIKIFSKAEHLDKSLYIDSYGSGVICFLGLNIDALLFDERSARKQFYAQTPRLPHEQTSLVSKGSITRLIFSLLRHLSILRGIPFVHKWFFPRNYENIFLFRIDTDYGTQKQIQTWYDLAVKYSFRYTWFLHTAAHEPWLDTFAGYHGHEIALHAYEHSVRYYKTRFKSNMENGYITLRRNGFTPMGFAAPYGIWNRTFASLCEDYKFVYASEFGYCYDSLPIYPFIDGRKSNVLQIPIHPICIGSLLKAKATDNDMIAYFKFQIQHQRALLQPLILYDHVLHNYHDVADELFKMIPTDNILNMTFLEFAYWWKSRELVRFTGRLNGNGVITIEQSADTNDCRFCIWKDDTHYLLTPAGETIDFTGESAHTNYTDNIYQKDLLKKTRTYNPRTTLFTILNNLFWRK